MQNPTTLELRRPNPYCIEVWLNRPDVRNAFNETVIAELTQVFQDSARNVLKYLREFLDYCFVEGITHIRTV